MIERYSDHAANERTFLAWVRTAIAIMAFGFLVQKFDLFLRMRPGPSMRDPHRRQSDCRQYCRTVADCARWRGDGFCRDSPSVRLRATSMPKRSGRARGSGSILHSSRSSSCWGPSYSSI
jgi:Domain of unknown function (DUF202)